MPLLETKGAGSAQGFGLSLGGEEAVYIEDVFSTYLYTGTDAAQTITNGIDLAGEGGLVWMKSRTNAYIHCLFDTERGNNVLLKTNSSGSQDPGYSSFFSFLSNGFSVNGNTDFNASGDKEVSWTFRKQPKFFDVVTYTGNGAASQTIAHSLGSVPGCMIMKGTSAATNWPVYHRSMDASPQNFYMILDGTTAKTSAVANWGNTSPTSTQFTVGANNNANGITYVAYLFAHDAGGFGLTGTDNVISCGSYTGNGSATGPVVTLGYEPQWVMVKRATVSTGQWEIYDSMRGLTLGNDAILRPNTSGAEVSVQRVNPTSTGFQPADSDGDVNASGSTYIYIAIRRGPMKVPTSGTSVFSPTLVTGNGTTDRQITGVGFSPDLLIGKRRGTSLQPLWYDKLRGKLKWLESSATAAEQTVGGGSEGLMLQDGFVVDNSYGSLNINTNTYVNWLFRRAPGFFDEVCATASGYSAGTQAHNLGVVPDLIISKDRSSSGDWYVWVKSISTSDTVLTLNSNTAASNRGMPISSVTASSFYSATAGTPTPTQVFYLFATLAGVSKVGSYTGTGTTQVINCGFTAGSRFIMIKRTDSTGDWYVWDSARGIVAGNDPYLLLNSTAAEVTNTDYVDTASTGFEISSTAPAAINASGGSFIFLAIA